MNQRAAARSQAPQAACPAALNARCISSSSSSMSTCPCPCPCGCIVLYRTTRRSDLQPPTPNVESAACAAVERAAAECFECPPPPAALPCPATPCPGQLPCFDRYFLNRASWGSASGSGGGGGGGGVGRLYSLPTWTGPRVNAPPDCTVLYCCVVMMIHLEDEGEPEALVSLAHRRSGSDGVHPTAA